MEKLLEVRGLKKYFALNKGLFSKGSTIIKAVDDVSFDLKEGDLRSSRRVGQENLQWAEAFKTIEPTAGEVNYKGENILSLKGESLRSFRKNAQMIFQDPYACKPKDEGRRCYY